MTSKTVIKIASIIGRVFSPIAAVIFYVLHLCAIYISSAINKTPFPFHAYFTTLVLILLGLACGYMSDKIYRQNDYSDYSTKENKIRIAILKTLGFIFWISPVFLIKPHLIYDFIVFTFIS